MTRSTTDSGPRTETVSGTTTAGRTSRPSGVGLVMTSTGIPDRVFIGSSVTWTGAARRSRLEPRIDRNDLTGTVVGPASGSTFARSTVAWKLSVDAIALGSLIER